MHEWQLTDNGWYLVTENGFYILSQRGGLSMDRVIRFTRNHRRGCFANITMRYW